MPKGKPTAPAFGEWSTILRKVPAAETAAGAALHIPFSRLPRERFGMPVHVVAVEVLFDTQHDEAGGGNTLPGAWFRAALKNIRLRAFGHDFVKELDGTAVDFLSKVKAGILDVSGDQSDKDTSGAAANDVATTDVSVMIACGRTGLGDSKRYDGAIPVRAFQGVENSDAGLYFEVATDFRGFPTVTIDSLTRCHVRVHLAALPDLRIPSPWLMQEHRSSDNIFEAHSDGVCPQLWAATYDATDPTVYQSSIYSDVFFRIDGQTMFEDVSYEEILRGHQMLRLANGISPNLIGMTDTGRYTPLVLAPVDALRTKMPRGLFELEFTDGASLSHRYLQESSGLNKPAYLREALRALGAPDDASIVPAGSKKDSPNAMPVIDNRVYWRGMPYEVPERKVR